MTHRRNVERMGVRPPSLLALAALVPGQTPPPRPRQITTVHAVACDCVASGCKSLSHVYNDVNDLGELVPQRRAECTHEFHAEAIEEYEWYVPVGWAILPDGTHRCPDCRTKAAVERDRAEELRSEHPLYKVRQHQHGLRDWSHHGIS